MTDDEQEATPKPRIRFGRILFALVTLALVAGGVYFASWLNARRYFLIIDKTEARVAKGRMLPTGHAQYVPVDPSQRKAYETMPLPGGMNLPRGTTTFTERVELDQAIFRLLRDATEFALAADNKRTPELTTRYLAQIKTLKGISVQQQLAIARLERDAQYVRARGLHERARRDLAEAARLYKASARGGGGRFADGAAQAHAIDYALSGLAAPPPARRAAPPRNPPPPVRTGTVATSTGS